MDKIQDWKNEKMELTDPFISLELSALATFSHQDMQLAGPKENLLFLFILMPDYNTHTHTQFFEEEQRMLALRLVSLWSP